MYLLSTYSRGAYGFSNAIAAKTYSKFQQKYSAHLDAFAKKTADHQKTAETVKRSTQKTFTHPYDEMYHRPVVSPFYNVQVRIDLLGAEQVSAHFEHFGRARRDLLLIFASYFGMRFIAEIPDFSYYADAWAPAIMCGALYLYYHMEGKTYMFLPLLRYFYRKITRHEVRNVGSFYSENIEVRIRNLMAKAKSQIDFKTLHSDYMPVRNNTILNFLINEQVALKNHLHERAENILKQVESIENMNQNKIINEVVNETFESVDKAYKENKAQIQKEMFQLALEGIAAGKMDYSKDPILPHVVKTIQKTVDKFNSISPEQQKKLVILTPDQMEFIKATDARARDEFLQNEPKIDGTLKNNDNIKQMLSKWGGKGSK